MTHLPNVAIRGSDKEMILIQGGMGAGISLANLAGSVARRGGVGTVSFVALDKMVGRRIGRKVSHAEAAALEIEEARRLSEGSGAIALNCMVLVEKTYRPSIEGGISAGVDMIIAGAGLPLTLPEIVGRSATKMVPIVSSGRALEIICRRWERSGRSPDAVVLEGPLAGGHLGFKAEDIGKPEQTLERLFPAVKETAQKHGDFPVIVAGGIYTRADILRWAKAGADGVQIGTRFAATHESGASTEFKNAIVAARPEDIEVAVDPGSPSGLPFRVLTNAPGYVDALQRTRKLVCDQQYLLHKNGDGKLTCRALESHDSFCICNGLLAAVGHKDATQRSIFTVGANAWRVDRILSVDELMDELTGAVEYGGLE